MIKEEFVLVLSEQISVTEDVLVDKAREYATDDVLHNFKVAASLAGVTVRQALAGMMVKHTVSIYDLCRAPNLAPRDVWSEKITDHINYLILLRALVHEESQATDPLLFIS